MKKDDSLVVPGASFRHVCVCERIPMPWFVISTVMDEGETTWRALDTPFRNLDDAWEAIAQEMSDVDAFEDDDQVSASVHVVEAQSVARAIDSLDLPG
jgi:hypothetical protein